MTPGANESAADTYDHLRFWVSPSNGPAYPVDLSEFARGGRKENVHWLVQRVWTGDYDGRPRLAEQIAMYHRVALPEAGSGSSARVAMRTFFRFLDAKAPLVTAVEDLTDAHGSQLKLWLDTEHKKTDAYHNIKVVISRIRQIEGLPQLWWPAGPRRDVSIQDDIDLLGMRRLYNALKSEAREIKAMFAEGKRLADIGRDPRGKSGVRGYWEHRANHAWLVRELSAHYIPTKREFRKNGGQGLHKANYPSQMHYGPNYLAPDMDERGREGIVGKLRWFYPSYHDTAVFLWLFLLGTGWNLSTAVTVDISSDDKWFTDHPHKTEFKIMHAYKGRARRHVFALSLGRPEWHPFQIVRFMFEKTRILRETLRRNLIELEVSNSRSPSPALASEIHHLRAAIRSPWLYHSVSKVGYINAIDSDESVGLNSLVRIVADRAGLLDEHPSLKEMSTAIARDAWIGFAYSKSGHNVLLAQLAAQHADVATLKHYISRRRYRAHSEAVIRSVQDAVFSEVQAKKAVDATRIRLLVRNGAITNEQEQRLLDVRQRTRLGMGCLDPTDPPREIAPGHPPGAICSVQRCVGCEKGIVFAESMDPLCRAKAELMHLRRELPLASWIGSSFEDEASSLDRTLAQFSPDEVEAAITAWTARIRSGEALVHDTYPSY